MTGNVIIVGAPRSGTNMLRDVLSRVDGFATWPCDEIPMIWRHGNRTETDDAFAPNLAGPRTVAFIRHEFSKIGRRYGAHTVIEKTCATSLRVPFVHRIFPEAKYIFIRRDGIDAAASADKRWHAEFDFKYTARKARFIPVTDVPYYGIRTARAILQRRGRDRGPTIESGWWGPKPSDWRTLAATHNELEMAFLQWKRCVDASLDAFDTLGGSIDVHEIRYEDFVADPAARTAAVLEFLGHPGLMRDELVRDVSTSSIRKGRSALGPEKVARLESLAGDTLTRLGYE